jgi:hypothetical protein
MRVVGLGTEVGALLTCVVSICMPRAACPKTFGTFAMFLYQLLHKRDKVTGLWRKLHNEELHEL